MEYFNKSFSQLADLESFDPQSFMPDGKVSKEICGFILTLALIYTDIKKLIIFYEAIFESKPKGEFKLQKDWGEYTGLARFLDRHNISILHELFNFIKKEKNLLEDEFIKSLVQALNKDARLAWQALIDASLEKLSSNKFSKDLMFIRNKITFHYDSKIVLKGFEHFIEHGQITKKAFISRGSNLAQSRFYFADAAAENYLISLSNPDDLEDFFKQVRDNIKKINVSIWYIVINFIQKRGTAFRKV
ncbi:MAG TPA: hypothetical protein VKA26_14390 [Ignavibacteriaceae bacterium]|nr:hypothetical protein [Ignavibacteriaceae bacterium]